MVSQIQNDASINQQTITGKTEHRKSEKNDHAKNRKQIRPFSLAISILYISFTLISPIAVSAQSAQIVAVAEKTAVTAEIVAQKPFDSVESEAFSLSAEKGIEMSEMRKYNNAAYSEALEKAIKTVKALFDISDSFEFNSSIRSANNIVFYDLRWNSKDGEESINVSIDDKLLVREYSKYEYMVYRDIRRAKLTKDETEKNETAVKEFLKKVLPDNYQEYVLTPQLIAKTPYKSNGYYANYHRVINGLPDYNDTLQVMLNTKTGEISSYYRGELRKTPDYPNTSAITLKEAQNAYLEQFGYKMVYRTKFENNTDSLKVYPVFEPKVEANDYAIDAESGKKIELWSQNIFYSGAGGTAPLAKLMMDTEAQNETIILTPEEQQAVDNASAIMPIEEAEIIARACEYLALMEDHQLVSRELAKIWNEKDSQIWNLIFEKQDTIGNRVHVTIDAKTSVILNFSIDVPGLYEDPNLKGTKTVEEAKSDMEKMIAAMNPQIMESLAYSETSDYMGIRPYSISINSVMTESSAKNSALVDSTAAESTAADSAEPDIEEYFSPVLNILYVRTANGIEYPDNYVTAVYDAVHGRFISMNTVWNTVKFPSIDKALPVEKIHEIVMDKVGLDLKYDTENERIKTEKAIDPIPGGVSILDYQSRKVYGLNVQNYYIVRVDALSGELLDYNGEIFRLNEAYTGYTDIEQNENKEYIDVLANMGIGLPGDKLRPDAAISQKDFLYLTSKLNQTLNFYTYPQTTMDLDYFYRQLISYDVLTDSERRSNRKVTNEEALRFIIKILDYDEIGKNYPSDSLKFSDAGDIGAAFKGYVALGELLSIISSGEDPFKPQKNISRADTFKLIYNYMVN